jgi:hypothetical protein
MAGCGGGGDKWKEARPPVFAAVGVVMFEGTPLEGASVTFSPVTGTHGASGRTDAEGRFSLTTFDQDDGAPAGQYRVSVTKSESKVTLDPRDPENLPPLKAEQIHLIPQKYSAPETSGLEAEVRDADTNEFRFELAGAAKK